MNESSFWRYLKSKIPVTAHFQRHEDIAAAGIPDLSYAWNGIDGWIELKYYKKWKKQDHNHIDSWTKVQRHWMRKRQEAGSGKCFLFIKIEKEYLLFTGRALAYTLERFSRERLIALSCEYWKDSVTIWELEKILCCVE